MTGPWTPDLSEYLTHHGADELVLNYAHGFEAQDLDHLSPAFDIRSLDVIDRSIHDMSPVARLAGLEELAFQAAPGVGADLRAFPRLTRVASEWSAIASTISSCDSLRDLTTWGFGESDLSCLASSFALQRLTVKNAPWLRCLDGCQTMQVLESLRVLGAPKLVDHWAVGRLNPRTIVELEVEGSPIATLEPLAALEGLRLLGIADCGDLSSLTPLAGMQELRTLLAWGSTRVLDCDLAPLFKLPKLVELRMRDRREYRPQVREHPAAVF